MSCPLTVARTAQVGSSLKGSTSLLPVELQSEIHLASTNYSILGYVSDLDLMVRGTFFLA